MSRKSLYHSFYYDPHPHYKKQQQNDTVLRLECPSRTLSSQTYTSLFSLDHSLPENNLLKNTNQRQQRQRKKTSWKINNTHMQERDSGLIQEKKKCFKSSKYSCSSSLTLLIIVPPDSEHATKVAAPLEIHRCNISQCFPLNLYLSNITSIFKQTKLVTSGKVFLLQVCEAKP